MKKLIPSYILAIVTGFMLFIYEPISMYANNTSDFWFDIYLIIKPNIFMFLLFVFELCILYTIVYLINLYFSKKLYVYKALVVLGIIVFIGLYVQGNFLIGNLPPLDGTEIDWTNYPTESIISAVVWLVSALAFTIATIKFKYDKTIKVYSFILVTIFVMLSTSFVSTLMKPGVFDRKEKVVVSTNRNLHKASTDKNFFLFVVDCVDSVMFKEMMDKSDIKGTFDDFTYYPDTMSTYAFTRESIPYILSGVWNENETEYNEYYNRALNQSVLLDEVDKRNYNMNMYEYEYAWTKDVNREISNIDTLNGTIDSGKYLRQILKYDAFKYFPYQLKRYSQIETLRFDKNDYSNEDGSFSWDDRNFYIKLTSNDIEKTDEKIFNYTHIEGAHVPYFYDKNLEIVGNGTYEMKMEATLQVINTFVNRLKDNGVYDNSVIIVMSDHGFNFLEFDGRQNAILFIKGIDEHHDMQISDIPISFTDLNDAYIQLLDGKKSTELFQNIEPNRKRRYLWYKYTEENHMVEYEQTGKAWDEDTLIPTGREYNR